MGVQSYNRDVYDSRLRDYGVKASEVIPTGSIVMVDSSGRAVKGVTATSLKGAGFSLDLADATGLADNAIRVKVDCSEAAFTNSAAGDQITAADIGAACYVVDATTLAKTNGSSTRSAYGVISGVTADGRVKAVPTLKF